MKKIFLILIVSSLTFVLPGCDKIGENAQKLVDDAKKSYENVVNEGKAAVEKFNETKKKVEETINDFNTAVEKIDEAKKAVEEITK